MVTGHINMAQDKVQWLFERGDASYDKHIPKFYKV